MILLPGFEHMPEPRPRVPWVTGTAVVILVGVMAASIVINVASDLLWPSLEKANISVAETDPRSGKIVEQYTRFRTEPIEGGDVVTGFEYAKSTDAVPSNQYCYLMKRHGAGVGLRITLAVKESVGAAPTYTPLSAEAAAQIGIPIDELAKLARERCRFDAWE